MTKPRIGIDLGGTKIEGVVLDEQGEVEFRHRLNTPKNDYPATIDAIEKMVQRLDEALLLKRATKEQSEDYGYQNLPVGIGTPGSISPATGKMRNSNSTALNGQNLKEHLTEHLSRPVRLANDADCFALSEATDGAGCDEALVFGVILGTGTGGGIVHNKKLIEGANGIAGEWGHITLPLHTYQREPSDELPDPAAGNRACYCGRIDCVETWVSGTGFEKSFEQMSGQSRKGEEISDLLENSASDHTELSHTAHQIFQQYCNLLALSLSSIINTLDPQIIVLGGGMSNIERIYTDLHYYLPRYVFSDVVSTKIVKATYGDSSGVRGAAWLWPDE